MSIETDSINLSGYVFDKVGIRKREWKDPIGKWEKLRSAGFGGAQCNGRCRRVLTLEFDRGIVKEIVVKGGLENAFKLERLVGLLHRFVDRSAFFTGFEQFYGIAGQYERLGAFSKHEDNLIERARVLIAAMELRRAAKCCKLLIRSQSKWEQEARRLLVRAMLFKGQFRKVERMLRVIDGKFPDETEAKVDYALASLSAGRAKGLRYAEKLVIEETRSFANVGLQVSRFLVSRERYEDALAILNGIKYRVGHDDIHLNWAISRLEFQVQNIFEHKSILKKGFSVRNFAIQTLLFIGIGALMLRYAAGAFEVVPGLIEKTSDIWALEKSGTRSEYVVVDTRFSDAKFGLKRVSYTYKNVSSDDYDKTAWRKGESLLFASDASRVVDEEHRKFVTFDPSQNGNSEIGPISYRRVIALWMESWDELQGAVGLFVLWILVCIYYLMRRIEFSSDRA